MAFPSLSNPPLRAWRSIAFLALFLTAVSASSAQDAQFGALREMVPLESDDTNAVALGDVEGDGDLDVLAVHDAQDRLWLNEGHGVFRDGTCNLPAEETWSRAVVMGDVDGDGDVDAVDGTGNLRLLINDRIRAGHRGRARDSCSHRPCGPLTGADRRAAVLERPGDHDADRALATRRARIG